MLILVYYISKQTKCCKNAFTAFTTLTLLKSKNYFMKYWNKPEKLAFWQSKRSLKLWLHAYPTNLFFIIKFYLSAANTFLHIVIKL